MTKEEMDAVHARCTSIDNIIISIEQELRMLRTHLDILTKVCETKPQTKCENCNHYKLTCDLFSEICKYESKDEPQTGCAWKKGANR